MIDAMFRRHASGTVLSLALFAAGPAHAIVTDTGGLPALPPALNVGGVGLISNGCSSVLLAGGQYVLASGHCAAAAGNSVSFLGGSVTAIVASTVFAPGYGGVAINDLSISRLVTPVSGIAGYAVAAATPTTTPSMPTTVVLAGYGASGSGSSGASGPTGTLRYGYNQYEELLADDPIGPPPTFYNGTVVGFDFDDGTAATNRFGSLGLSGEAMLAVNDSGGPSFAFISGAWQIVGIHVAVADNLGFGYGAIGYDMLTGEYDGWIGSVTAVPEPASVVLMLAGLLGLGLRAKNSASRA